MAEQKPMQENYHLISPTAQLVTYARQFTDIPFAKEVAAVTGAAEVLQKFAGDEQNQNFLQKIFPIMVEARYKSAWQTLKKHEIKQVLEFAAGLSFRGALLAQNNPDMVFVETDLPSMTDEKMRVMKQIPELHCRSAAANLFMHSANALVYSEIEPFLYHFSKKSPIGILNEGFLIYLTMEEKRVFATNCRKLLETFGGVWVTPDIITKEEFEQGQRFQSNNDPIKEHTGRSFQENAFRNHAEVQEFFASLGLQASFHLQVDGGFEMSCRNYINIPDDIYKAITNKMMIWTMSLQNP